MQLVVLGVEHALLHRSARAFVVHIPGQHRLPGRVHQHPAVTRVHAVLEEKITGNVIAGNETGRGIGGLIVRYWWRDVLHHQVAARVAYPQRLAFGVELGVGEVFFVVHHASGIRNSVMGNADHFPAEAVENGKRGRVGMLRGQLRSALALRVRNCCECFCRVGFGDDLRRSAGFMQGGTTL